MQRRTSGEEVDLRVEGTITTTIAATVEAVNMVAATIGEGMEGGSGNC